MSRFDPDPGTGRRRMDDRRVRRAPRPLDAARLEELALAYVARFATSAAKLEAYLLRKLRAAGWVGEDPSGEEALMAGRQCAGRIVVRFVDAGYVDDESFARARTGSLLRRGYGARRIAQALGEAGVDERIRAEIAPGEHARREAALAYARKRGFGPFIRHSLHRDSRREERDPALYQKQMASMLRAGHAPDMARRLLESADEAEAESWVEEAREAEREG